MLAANPEEALIEVELAPVCCDVAWVDQRIEAADLLEGLTRGGTAQVRPHPRPRWRL